jgi:enoyl-CoA hydratase/carnithine racemase
MRLGSVNYETRGKVALLTLDEPSKLNALSAGIRQGILEGLAKADADDAIRVAVITGSGDKAFCAGADIGEFDFDPEKARSFLISAMEVLAAPENTCKPVISAVNGIAYGGGFELAISSDFIIASDRARFAVPEIKPGLCDRAAAGHRRPRQGQGDEHAWRSHFGGGGLPTRYRAPRLASCPNARRCPRLCRADRLEAKAGRPNGEIVLQSRARRR